MAHTPRTDADEQVALLLRRAKEALGLSVAYLSRMDDTHQTLQVVDTSIPLLFQEGYRTERENTFCQAILDGELPPVIPDVAALPRAMEVPSARMPRIRSFVSVPVRLSDGTLYGTFCAAALRKDRGLTRRDQSIMEVLAEAAAVVIEPVVRESDRAAQIRSRLEPLIAVGGPRIVLQPIVAIATGQRTGAEALSRFPREWGLAPDVCFEQAHSVGLGPTFELLALEGAARTLETVSGYVGMNVSPEVLLQPQCRELFDRLPAERLLIELSEHDPVEDYAALTAALKPLRAKGARLGIDDVGSGFSSLRHIVLTEPDVIKIDRTIAAGVAADPVLHTLVRSLVSFAHSIGATVVAEGIETEDDARALLELEVDYGQGWFYGRPVDPAELDATPYRGVTLHRPQIPVQRTGNPAEQVTPTAPGASAQR